VIDKTAPGIDITGIENDAMYNETEREITVAVSDNYAVSKAELIIDGEVVEEYGSDVIEENDGRLTYTLKESEDWTTISAAAYDAAGNASSVDEYKVFLTTGLLHRLRNSGIVIPVSITGIIALIIAAFLTKKAVLR
jgi:adenosylcobinamide amidohydrolase